MEGGGGCGMAVVLGLELPGRRGGNISDAAAGELRRSVLLCLNCSWGHSGGVRVDRGLGLDGWEKMVDTERKGLSLNFNRGYIHVNSYDMGGWWPSWLSPRAAVSGGGLFLSEMLKVMS